MSEAEAATVAEDRLKSSPAAILHAKHQALTSELADNPYSRPLVLESRQSPRNIDGEIYAVIFQPFAKVSASLAGPQVWCDILSLHQNTKYCGVERGRQATLLTMNVGKKSDQPLQDSFRLALGWERAAQTSEYLLVSLNADSGPLGTHDYRIRLEAVPLQSGETFLHLSYSYGFGISGKIAMETYLATVGRNKVGFTVTGKGMDGRPVHVDGLRGLIERNTMRYYLAIESYLGALSVPESEQFEKRISDWFSASERYPRQLHELERRDYLDMKRSEYRRQRLTEKTGLLDSG
ncbi:MAG: hypothetical protein JNN20_17855 [Betaproteobacteria bacterium]|nr:hypothetical protein [Betaproteobacteria bacterium]